MALVFRSIVRSPSTDFVDVATDQFASWLKRKVRDDGIDPAQGQTSSGSTTYEWGQTDAEDSSVRARRAFCFEQRSAEQVKVTQTLLVEGTNAWGWVDVERWAEDVHTAGWIPVAPKLLANVLERVSSYVGPDNVHSEPELIERGEVGDLYATLRNLDREVPIVVVSPTKEERDGDVTPCQRRAEQIQRHLTGVARVVLLGPGSTTDLSRRLTTDLGEGWDVHSGAIRTYLPGLGDGRDRRTRHRFIPFGRVRGREDDAAARLISLPLIQAACLMPPPAVWRLHARALPEFSGASGTDSDEIFALLEDTEGERDEAEKRATAAETKAGAAQESEAELAQQLEKLTARIRYLESRLDEFSTTARHEQPATEVFSPAFCEEVVEHARAHLQHVRLAGGCEASARALDAHADNESWARKAWRAIAALEAYANAKAAGEASGTDFRVFCTNSGDPAVIPATWIALSESETTGNNARYRQLRTLPVDPEVDPTGTVYMPAHIKIEKGGMPSPRIHFFDDTSGATKQIHVGWFGDHLDSAGKS